MGHLRGELRTYASTKMAWFLQMKANDESKPKISHGEQIYRNNCASCHKDNRSGIPASGYPSLLEVGLRLSKKHIQDIITHGKGMMPGFPQLTPKDQEMLLQFLTHKMAKNNTQEIQDKTEETQLPFQHTGYNKFLDKNIFKIEFKFSFGKTLSYKT